MLSLCQDLMHKFWDATKIFQYYMKDKTEMLEVNRSTVGECLDILVGKFPELKKFIYKEEGKLLAFTFVYVNEDYRHGLDLLFPVKDGDILDIIFPRGA